MQLPQGLTPQQALLVLYGYTPSQGAAILAVVAYALLSIAATAVTVQTRAWYMLLVTLVALLELAGWGSRLTTVTATPTGGAHGWQQCLLIITPVLLAIVQYITLAKLLLLPATASSDSRQQLDLEAPQIMAEASTGGASIRIGVGPHRSSSASSGGAIGGDHGGEVEGSVHSCEVVEEVGVSFEAASDAGSSGSSGSEGHPMLAVTVLCVFSVMEFVCVLLQTSGAAVYADPFQAMYGQLLLLSGLGIQLAFAIAFMVLLGVVQTARHFRFRSDPGSFRWVFVCLYATCSLMLLRTTFRIAEFAQGYGFDIDVHEGYLYGLDFVPVLLCVLLFTCLHFGWWLGPGAVGFMISQSGGAQAADALQVSELFIAAAAGADVLSVSKQQQQEAAAVVADESSVLHVQC